MDFKQKIWMFASGAILNKMWVLCYWHSLALFWEQDEVFSNNPHTLDELKQSIHETVTSVDVNELKLMLVFSRYLNFV
jgi:hypothetical protein